MNPLEQNVSAILNRAEQELNQIISSMRLALDPDIKVSLAVFSYLLCAALDHLWMGLCIAHNSSAKKEYFLCVTDPTCTEQDLDDKFNLRHIPLTLSSVKLIKAAQPCLQRLTEDKWLQHLKYFRNFNSHNTLSAGESYDTIDIINDSSIQILNVSYMDDKEGEIRIENAYVFLDLCLKKVQEVANSVFTEAAPI